MGRDFDAWEEHGRLMVQAQDRLIDLPPPGLYGPHQFANAGLAVAALLTLADARIGEAALGAGVGSTVWPGRFQRLVRGPLAEMAAGTDLWVDGAHNPHAGRALADACGRLTARDARPLALIVGMLGRKDASGFFEAFKELAPRVFATAFSSPSATPAETLVEAARSQGICAEAADGVEDALARALASPGPPPHVVICGSLHFIGDVLAMSPDTWPT
jgi:dihydrofolate synthase/folylpolyglutamate synthase